MAVAAGSGTLFAVRVEFKETRDGADMSPCASATVVVKAARCSHMEAENSWVIAASDCAAVVE